MCSSGGGGGGGSTTISTNTITDPIVDTVQEKVIDPVVDTVQEEVIDPVVDKIDETYQGSDIDTTLEDAQDTAQLMYDVVDSIISGEEKGTVKESKDELGDFKDKGDEAVEDIKETATNLVDPNNPDSLLNTTVNQTTDTSTSIASNISRNFKQRMAREGFKTLDSNYDPSLDDPYLMMRRGGRRKRGREKAVRQGALRIPSSGIGVQIPS